MATFEDICKANEAMTPIDVKGKLYMEVNQRIKAFRMVYPEGFIETNIVSVDNGVCIIHAVCGNDGKVLGSGTAYEKEGSTFINKTSYIENCETSAVGRALGMAGFGIDVSVTSAEELQNAMLNQAKAEKISKVQLAGVKAAMTNKGYKEDKICEYFGIEKLEDMTIDNLNKFTEMMNSKKKEG
jgi:hypothetical protein